MKRSDVVRALRDPEVRARLSEEERAQLPAHPSGVIELNESELTEAFGGYAGQDPLTFTVQSGTSIRSSSCRDYCCA